MKTIKQTKIELVNILNKSDIIDSNSIVSLIMQKVFGCEKHYLLINENEFISNENEIAINKYINDILQGKPIEYITNRKEFMNCEIYVNENVLIPRPDTEILVENIINILNKYINNDVINILELCCGSGCISVGLLTYLKQKDSKLYDKINILAIDISKQALQVAKRNVEKYDLSKKIKLIESDLFNNITKDKFNIIVSNPPYIRKYVIDKLDDSVKNEPIIALDGGIDGLDFYREISDNAKSFLNDNGYLLYEIGYDQANEVKKILIDEGYNDICIKKDLSNNDRVIISRK